MTEKEITKETNEANKVPKTRKRKTYVIRICDF